MKLEDVRENYQYFSEKLSDIVRQLGFAGIALIWVFKTDTTGKQLVPPEMLPAAKLIVISLGLDLLHYIAGTFVWAVYNAVKEQNKSTEKEQFLAPRWINWPALFLFWAKIIFMVFAYIYILAFLLTKIA